jgi:thioredoxin reductase (NADPH)
VDPSLFFEMEEEYDYDLIVIGGGSGGLSTSKRAAELGARVACFDFVKPSTQGNEWGLGGTCVNVGCIPKKLYHTASLYKDSMSDARRYGWNVSLKNLQMDWETLADGILGHIQELNFGYRKQLLERSVTYINQYASFVDAHTVKGTDSNGNEKLYTSKYFCLATGCRPSLPDTPGVKEYAMTSDDIFFLEESPGKTLVVGGSYIALECGGYLAGLGCDVTIMVRSILLRGFDQQIAEHIGEYMKVQVDKDTGEVFRHGVNFIRPAIVNSIVKQDGRLVVSYNENDEAKTDIFDTVMYATGREAKIEDIGIENVGIQLDLSGKIVVSDNDATSVENIFAIGDIGSGRPELTPVAIQAGKLLAKRLFSKSTVLMDYNLIPTTVFTPIEYGCIGLSEEDAVHKYGADDIEVYHTYFKPLEYFIPDRPDNECYAKLICVISENERVVGFHYVGPHAAEVTQGYALGMRLGATKSDFDDTVGIHPSISEEFTTLDITRRSGLKCERSGC